MSQDRLTGGFGSSGDYDYDVGEVRSLVENDFIGYEDLYAATDGVLRVLSDSIVEETVVTTSGYENYSILDVNAIGEKRKVRPVNTDLFIDDVEAFNASAEAFHDFLIEISENKGPNAEITTQYPEFIKGNRINETLYTFAQGVGIGLDALSSSKNKARKHAGLRFESVIEKIIDTLGIENDNHFFKIPIGDSDDEYSCEVDLILSPSDDIQSTKTSLDPDEMVVSIKTTSKDRMTKIFTDKMLMSQFLDQDVQLLAFFLHDVQRSGQDGIASTFVANNYYIYYEYLTPLEGTYFIDPPKKIEDPGYNDKLSTFKDLIVSDLWDYY